MYSQICFEHRLGQLHSSVMVSTVASARRFLVWILTGALVWSLLVLIVHAWVLSKYSDFLPPSKNMHVRLTGDSKLLLGVSVSMVCLVCLYVALWWTGNLSKVYPAFCPIAAGIASSELNWHKWVKKMDGCIDEQTQAWSEYPFLLTETDCKFMEWLLQVDFKWVSIWEQLCFRIQHANKIRPLECKYWQLGFGHFKLTSFATVSSPLKL